MKRTTLGIFAFTALLLMTGMMISCQGETTTTQVTTTEVTKIGRASCRERV